MSSPRARFLDAVRRVPGARAVVSPFLPHPPLVARALHHLGLPARGDPVADEIRLSRALDYEPTFMTDCPGVLFPWAEDPRRSDEDWIVSTLSTPAGEWVRRTSRRLVVFGMAIDEGIDLMSESSYGLEMISPQQFEAQDLHYTRRLAGSTRGRHGPRTGAPVLASECRQGE